MGAPYRGEARPLSVDTCAMRRRRAAHYPAAARRCLPPEKYLGLRSVGAGPWFAAAASIKSIVRDR